MRIFKSPRSWQKTSEEMKVSPHRCRGSAAPDAAPPSLLLLCAPERWVARSPRPPSLGASLLLPLRRNPR